MVAAVRYVTSLCSTAAPGARLPTTQEMARRAGVSPVTMTKALAQIAGEAGLQRRPGAGIRVAGCEQPAVASRQARWQVVRTAVEQDILEGRFRTADRLPSRKELAAVYGCGFPVLARALRSLTEDGMLHQRRRAMVPAHSRLMRSGSSVLLVTGDDFARLIDSNTYRNRVEVFTGVLEQECARRNLLLRRTMLSASSPWGPADCQCMGALFYQTASTRELTNGAVTELRGRGVPVALFLESSARRPDVGGSAPLTLMSLDDEEAGFQTGQELLRLGHRVVCFVGLADSGFADLRLAGLRRSFAAAGFGEGVHTRRFAPDAPYIDARRGQMIARDRAEVQRVDEQLLAFAALRRLVSTLSLDEANSSALEIATNLRVYFASCRRNSIPVLREALAIPGLTALVAADDNIALHGVLPLLQREGVRVPRDVSVVSFNATFEAAQAGLSSYQFDFAWLAVRMLDSVLEPRRGRPHVGEVRSVAVRGALMRRPSLGQARPA